MAIFFKQRVFRSGVLLAHYKLRGSGKRHFKFMYRLKFTNEQAMEEGF